MIKLRINALLNTDRALKMINCSGKTTLKRVAKAQGKVKRKSKRLKASKLADSKGIKRNGKCTKIGPFTLEKS